MAESFKNDKPLLNIVEIDPTENIKIKRLKRCIFRMTAFSSQERCSLEEVKQNLNSKHQSK